MTRIVLATLLLFTAVTAFAQSEGNSTAKSQAEHSRAVEPSAELQSLIHALSGKWSLSVKFEPSPEMPNGGDLSGEETWRPGPGGFTLIEEERLPTPGGDIFLLGIIWWDKRTMSFQGMECNSQLPSSCDPKGSINDITLAWDGKQFAIREREIHGSKQTIWHEVWSDISENSFIQTGESEDPDGSRKRLLTIHAKRVE
jgi:hypothetical protein